jgi:predicted Fe-Mo cluster-binding NifX family protein
MRVALTTWNGRVSPVFDVARQLLILDVEENRVTARREEPLPGTDPEAQADRVAALGADVLICGAVSRPMAAWLAAKKVRVMPFTAGAVDEVIAAWLSGKLPGHAWCMPGCCGRIRHGHGQGGGRGGRGPWRCQQRTATEKE